jgi:hypothetical protein
MRVSNSVAELGQQIHADLRIQHPEWVQPNGECPFVIRTRRAWWNCSTVLEEPDPTKLSLIFIARLNMD